MNRVRAIAPLAALAIIIGIAVLLIFSPTYESEIEEQKAKNSAPPPRAEITNSEPPNLRTPEPPNDPARTAASNDIRALSEKVSGLLLLLKDPYRPPLGDNTDITLALTGHNRRNTAALETNDPSIVDGQLVDRWGTPYWFHPRAADAIDILSAGPDKILFTPDDIASEHFQPLEKAPRKIPATGNSTRKKFQ